MGLPQNGWFLMDNPIKMDDLGVPLFSETSIYFQDHCQIILKSLPLVCFGGSSCRWHHAYDSLWCLADGPWKIQANFAGLGRFFFSMFPEGTWRYYVLHCSDLPPFRVDFTPFGFITFWFIDAINLRPWSAPICTTRTKTDQELQPPKNEWMAGPKLVFTTN